MSKTAKILVTIVIVFVFAIVFGSLSAANHGKSPGILGLILFLGLIGAIKAMWKSKSNDDSDDNDNSSVLQK